MGKIVLFIGGARSGKSRRAEQYAAVQGGPVVYLATAAAGDDEMRSRIARHREQRPPEWRTIEAQQGLSGVMRDLEPGTLVLLDCLTLLTSNVLFAHEDDPEPALDAEVAGLLAAAIEQDLSLIVVTNEVGMGIVPEYPLGRRYRDLLGRANQRVALAAAEVYLVVAGIAVELHALETAFERGAV